MATHNLKMLPEYFQSVTLGNKTFELRKNDRDYRIGDIVNLCEYFDGKYTGYEIKAIITYVLKNCPEYGLDKDYCVFSFTVLSDNFS